MRYFTRKSALVGFALVGVLMTTALPGTPRKLLSSVAYAAASHDLQNCHAVKVTLNGNNPPTLACADPVQSGAGPLTSQTSCNNGDLMIYDQTGYSSGNKACFTGQGNTNLTAIPYPGIGQNWNDRARSYHPGSWSGRFYIDINESGNHWVFSANQPSNFGAGWDQQVSSICISTSGCPGGNP